MKKVLIAILKIIVTILISALVLYINVFSKEAKANIQKEEKALANPKEEIIEENEEIGYEKQIQEIEERAKADIEKEEITEAKIEEAITYIETNIEVKEEEINSETIKQIAYYGAYLKNLTSYNSEEKKNEISILGENSVEYSKEALKFIEKQEKIKEENTEKQEKPKENNQEEQKTVENEQQQQQQINSEQNTVPEVSATPIATPISEPTEMPVVINVIEVNTSTTLEKAKTKVRSSISKVNNLNRKKLVTELKERIDNSSQNKP